MIAFKKIYWEEAFLPEEEGWCWAWKEEEDFTADGGPLDSLPKVLELPDEVLRAAAVAELGPEWAEAEIER
jgi:hypothetical protein